MQTAQLSPETCKFHSFIVLRSYPWFNFSNLSRHRTFEMSTRQIRNFETTNMLTTEQTILYLEF